MKELNLLVENYFSPALGATDILRLVEQIMDETPMIVSEAQEDIDVGKEMTIDDLLGSLSINPKAWGNPEQTDGDRAVIQNYASSLGLGDNANNPDVLFKALAESFRQLQATDEDEENKCSLMKSLSVIQILNTMSRVMSDIGNASASGFVMEAFLAALFPNGKWESDAAGAGLADFTIQGGEGSATDHLISLKTISDIGTIEGSKYNLLYDLFGDGTRSGGVVTYYILAKPKDGKSLHAKKFDITEKNVSDLTGITPEQIRLWKERHYKSTGLKPEIDEMRERGKSIWADIKDVWTTIIGNSNETISAPESLPGKPETAKKWLRGTLKGMGVNLTPEEFEAFAQKYIDYKVVSKELSLSKNAPDSLANRYASATTRWGKEQWGGDTSFYVKQEKAESVAILNIDPKVLYETANKSLKSIVGQLVQIQKDYRDTVREMHSYLSTLSNATAAGFKKEVAEFDQSVQTIKDSTECEPDFLK